MARRNSMKRVGNILGVRQTVTHAKFGKAAGNSTALTIAQNTGQKSKMFRKKKRAKLVAHILFDHKSENVRIQGLDNVPINALISAHEMIHSTNSNKPGMHKH